MDICHQMRGKVSQLWRKSTSRLRKLPDFIIIGAQKSGTTSLYEQLVRHPRIISASKKEVHFFDLEFRRGIQWYRSHFPLPSSNYLTGESSPFYLMHPLCPERCFQTVPDAKLIVILRNPVHRAYSHYQHFCRLGFETLDFSEAIAKEDERLAGEVERVRNDDSYICSKLGYFSYKERGKYIKQIECWLKFYDKGKMLVLIAEDFFNDSSASLDQICDFLDIPSYCNSASSEKVIANSGGQYLSMSQHEYKSLSEFFKPYNKQLGDFLGRDLPW